MSRELDARVAEAMGWTWYETEQEWGWKLPNGNWACENEGTPAFSTNPAACEEVKKAMRDKSWRWTVDGSPCAGGYMHTVHINRHNFWKGNERLASVFNHINQHTPWDEYEAICLAFLAAVEAEKGAKQ